MFLYPTGGSEIGGGSTPSQDTPAIPAAATPDIEQLTQQILDQSREIENLRAARARSLQIAVTQFQKGLKFSL